MKAKIIQKRDLAHLLGEWLKGYELFAPVKRDDLVVFRLQDGLDQDQVLFIVFYNQYLCHVLYAYPVAIPAIPFIADPYFIFL